MTRSLPVLAFCLASSLTPVFASAQVITHAAGTVRPASLVAGLGPQDAPAPSRPLGPPPGRAGGRSGANAPAPPANPDLMTAQQVEQYVDSLELFQARNQLQLSDEQVIRTFGSRLQRLQMLKRQQQRQRRMLVLELNQMLTGASGAVDETVVAAKVKELDDRMADFDRQIQDATAAIDQTLTPRQRARFRVFEEQMERRKLELLARARQQARPAP